MFLELLPTYNERSPDRHPLIRFEHQELPGQDRHVPGTRTVLPNKTHQDPVNLKEQEPATPSPLASQHRHLGPSRESAPRRLHGPRASQHRHLGPSRESAPRRLHGLRASQHLAVSTSSTPHNRTWNQTNLECCRIPAWQTWNAALVPLTRRPGSCGAVTLPGNRTCPRRATPATTEPTHCTVRDAGEPYTRCRRRVNFGSTNPTRFRAKDPKEHATRRRRTPYRRTYRMPRCRTHATWPYYSLRRATTRKQGA